MNNTTLYLTLNVEMCGHLARDEFGKGGYNNKTRKALDKEICQSLIGCSYEVCSELWNMINPHNRHNNNLKLKTAQPKHLFWALLFMKTYCTEPVLTRVVGGVDAGTFRSWVWLFISEIASLKPRVIVFSERFKGWDRESVCLISVDGVDCAVQEPYPFNSRIYSEKLNGPGLKYEVASCIATGSIVWTNGPFEAGRNDVTIFQEDGLGDALCNDECVEVDNGYKGDNRLKYPTVARNRDDRKQKSKVRARQENVNARLKQFAVLDGVFRHNINLKAKHKLCFESVAVITQLGFELCSPLYQVKYNAKYY